MLAEPADEPVAPARVLRRVIGVGGDQDAVEERLEEQRRGNQRAGEVGIPVHERVAQVAHVGRHRVKPKPEFRGDGREAGLDLVGQPCLVRDTGQEVDPADEDQVGQVGVAEHGRPGVDATTEERGDAAGWRPREPLFCRRPHLDLVQGRAELPVLRPGTLGGLELPQPPQQPRAYRLRHRQRAAVAHRRHQAGDDRRVGARRHVGVGAEMDPLLQVADPGGEGELARHAAEVADQVLLRGFHAEQPYPGPRRSRSQASNFQMEP